LLRSQSNQSGIEWMIVCSFWENVFQFSLATEDEVVGCLYQNFLKRRRRFL
jgi:hypothetical protein